MPLKIWHVVSIHLYKARIAKNMAKSLFHVRPRALTVEIGSTIFKLLRIFVVLAYFDFWLHKCL